MQTSRNTKFYYKVRKVSSVSASVSIDGKKIKYEISFLCDPFKYYVENPEIKLKNGDIVENNGKLFSRPVFKINASGEFTVDVNGTQITINNPSDSQPIDIVIDCEKMIVYTGNEMLKTSGKFPLLAVGNNKITWSGQNADNISMSVIVNGRCY